MEILSGNKRTPDGYLVIVVENLNEESKNKILQILNDDLIIIDLEDKIIIKLKSRSKRDRIIRKLRTLP
ncbi:MAG TPA: hypothetical protein ENG40_00200 [Thermoprotei archaeon]|nr:hypothetical protein [Thermoprotei archaeon]